MLVYQRVVVRKTPNFCCEISAVKKVCLRLADFDGCFASKKPDRKMMPRTSHGKIFRKPKELTVRPTVKPAGWLESGHGFTHSVMLKRKGGGMVGNRIFTCD